MTIQRAARRFVDEHPGIRTWHSFSAGPHYDPENIAFGPVIGCDEHLLEPGAGFDWHAHRGVVILSWVLDGTLRHQDDGGAKLVVPVGGVLVQSAGDGIRHRETNPSDAEALRVVQLTLLLELDRSVSRPDLPVRVGGVELDVVRAPRSLARGYAFVGSDDIALDGMSMQSGDSARLDTAVEVAGSGTVLAVRFGR